MRFAAVGFVVALLAAVAGRADAQTIYRCGNEYTRVPCANGRVLESSDPRTAAQRAEARKLVADEKRLGAELERRRRRDEAALKPAQAASLSAAPAASAAASAPKKKSAKKRHRTVESAETRDFVATVPGAKKK